MSEVLVVFTAKVGGIESEGGTASWALSARSMRGCEYVICTRNTDPAAVEDFGDRSAVPHRAAFLVGKVIGLEGVMGKNGRKRYRVLMGEVADVLFPDFWDRSRVPTRYFSKAEAEARGDFAFDSLEFRPINKANASEVASDLPISAVTALPGLSINEAKAGLALRFGVSTDEIDIVIRG